MNEIKRTKLQRMDWTQRLKPLEVLAGSVKRDSRVRYSKAIVALMFMSTWLTSLARPLPEKVHDPIPLTQVGEGVMSWFGINIYKVSFWNASGRYKDMESDLPLVLHITYQRNIKSKKLVEATLEQWERFGFFDPERRALWGQTLAEIWPDVNSGDSITTFVSPSLSTRFFKNGQSIGQVNDPLFTRALISIWLHPDTEEPELRKKLIRGTGVSL